MSTHAASGHSTQTKTDAAAEEAMRQALAGLEGPPTAAFVFASPRHDLSRILATIESLAPGVACIGCSTAGELTDRGVLRGGIAVLLLATDMVVARGHALGTKSNPTRAGTQLCDAYGEAQRTATSRGLAQSTSVVHELDGRPAFDLYREHARQRGVELTPATAGPYLIAHELGVFFLDELQTARAPLGVDARGALSCAAEVPDGATVAFLEGEPDAMIRAARRAAEEALAALGGHPAAAVLVFDCVCRATILGDEVDRELGAIKEVFPDTPIAGFFTYGEIARARGKLEGWHNTTAVVVAIPA